MGITIRYRGSVNDLQSLKRLVDEVGDICEIMKWEYRILDDGRSGSGVIHHLSAGENADSGRDAGLKGIGFRPHRDGGWVNLFFDGSGRLRLPPDEVISLNGEGEKMTGGWSPVTGRFIPATVHIAVIKLLRRLKNAYLPDLEVIDEGGYWETGDAAALARRIDAESKADDAAEAVSAASGADAPPYVKFSDYLEEVIREINEKKRPAGE